MVLARDVPNVMWGFDEPGSKVTVSFSGVSVTAVTPPDDNVWTLQIPVQKASTSPVTITVSTTSGWPAITLEDVLFGDLFICSGQSNMELSVGATVNQSAYAAESAQFGPTLRILQVEANPNFENTTARQRQTDLSIPWARVGPSNVRPMSAVCYYFGREAVLRNPQVPIGLLASSWGGTAINVWMDPAVAQNCSTPEEPLSFVNPDPGTQYLKGQPQAGFPTKDGCLYYSMITPLLPFRVTGMLWYQGESNAGSPVSYSRCFPAMIKQWRSDFDQTSGTPAVAPFLFVQISSWPAGDGGTIAVQRFAQQAALALPKVGMAVAADIGDPASPIHPIHPIMKQEVARRLFLSARNLLFNDPVPVDGPRIVKIVMDQWQPSWGDYHQGAGSLNVCAPGTGMFCVGFRVYFDQKLILNPSYQSLNGHPSAFEFVASNGGTQPVGLTGLSASDPTMLQLNATIVAGPLEHGVLRYAWRDYPSMPLTNSFGQPAPAFNVSVA